MFCIVPLAGPDFYRPSYGIRPLIQHEGEAFLNFVLRRRQWMQSGELQTENIIFVLRESEGLSTFREWLREEYPKAQITVISALTRGALCSCLAGTSLIGRPDEPIILDLADLSYTSDFSANEMFAKSPALAGIIPYFTSDLDCYSYLELDGTKVLRTVEKKVISENASAGTYFFRNLPVLLECASGALTTLGPEPAFVCPAYNALISKGHEVVGHPVTDVLSFSKSFH